MPDIKQWDAKILATDIDTEMVRRGSEGIYAATALEGMAPDIAKKYFEPYGADKVRLTADARSLISFKYLNLIGNWPMKGPFDAIFCRNVVIYFDKDTQRVLFEALRKPAGAGRLSLYRPFREPVRHHRAVQAAGPQHPPQDRMIQPGTNQE